MDIIEDIVGGSFYLDDSGGGAVRVFYATNIEASDYTSTDNLKKPSSHLYNVMLDSRVPNHKEEHPTVSNLFVSAITITPEEDDNSICKIVITYTSPSNSNTNPTDPNNPDAEDRGTIQIGSTVSSQKTNKDASGNPIVVTLSSLDDQLGEIEILKPETVLSFERKENESPTTKARDHVGKINATRLGVKGEYSPHTLLCVGIEGSSTDGGLTYNVSYRFQYNPDTWDLDVVYIDPETNQPHKDVKLTHPKDGVSENVEVYQTSNFTLLSLAF